MFISTDEQIKPFHRNVKTIDIALEMPKKMCIISVNTHSDIPQVMLNKDVYCYV